MNIKDILSIGKKKNDYSNTEFRKVSGDASRTVKTIRHGSGRNSITLAPMRSLSLETFTFPFSNTTKIREALRLQVMPFSAAGELEIFPVVTSKAGRGASGLVWYVSPDELEIPSPVYDSGKPGKIWPSPLPFISQLSEYDGNGATIWLDEENICSILWQKNKPVLYRWKRLSGDDPAGREAAWYDAYCAARGLERGGNFAVNASGDEEADDDFAEIVTDSVNICPWISEVNLSRSALEGARDLERTVSYLTRASCWLLVIGVVALSSGLVRWYHLQEQVNAARSRSENYYRRTFDPERTGRVSNPVMLARDRIASLTGTGDEGHPIDEVLADLGDIFRQGQNLDVAIDIIRYNSEGIDCTGVAPDMTTVLNFRRAWETKAQLAQVDNTQFVSGIGYRFDLRVRW